jgi:hypothetical protein
MENQVSIHKDILIEELIEAVPASVSYLLANGIPCIVCGEPLWGSLADAARSKGMTEDDIERIIRELNMLQEKR